MNSKGWASSLLILRRRLRLLDYSLITLPEGSSFFPPHFLLSCVHFTNSTSTSHLSSSSYPSPRSSFLVSHSQKGRRKNVHERSSHGKVLLVSHRSKGLWASYRMGRRSRFHEGDGDWEVLEGFEDCVYFSFLPFLPFLFVCGICEEWRERLLMHVILGRVRSMRERRTFSWIRSPSSSKRSTHKVLLDSGATWNSNIVYNTSSSIREPD